MKTRVFFIVVSSLLLYVGCSKPNITISSDSILRFEGEASNKSVFFSSSHDWAATASEPWITVAPKNGEGGDHVLSVFVSNNDPNNGSRNGFILIESEGISQRIVVEQTQQNAIDTNNSTYTIEPSGTTLSITVNHNVDLNVSIEATAKEWIHYIGTKAMARNDYEFSIDSNHSTNNRSSVISFKGEGITKDVTIFQKGEYLNISSDLISFNPEESSKTLDIQSSCSWIVRTEDSWISTSSLSGEAGTSKIVVSVTENVGLNARNGRVTIENVDLNIIRSIAISQKEYAWYIDENGVNQGHGINIDGKIWAPVNCGYHPTDAPRGLYYQWGRKYGQGYHPQTADIWEGKNGEEDKNTVYYYPLRDQNEGTKYAKDWIRNGDNTYWNLGTEQSPKKNESYDPCPKGWRVPTGTEITSLIKNWYYSALDEPGVWFSGSVPYAESGQNKIFLPGAGQMCYAWSWESNGSSFKCMYWTSSIEERATLEFSCTTAGTNIYVPYRRSGLNVRCIHE